MKVLCITDQYQTSKESLIEGIFRGALRQHCTIFVVVFSREAREVTLDGNEICLPYRYKKRGAAGVLEKHLDLHQMDVVIVRNFFSVLRSFLQVKSCYSFRLGFWNTFPHSFRRYFQALQEHRAVLRKRLEYQVRSYLEKRLVGQCDFLIVMSEEFKRSFYDHLAIAYHTLPMGFDLGGLPESIPSQPLAKRFVYIGTIDSLRKTDLIIKAMTELEEEFVLDIYTQSENDEVAWIRKLGDARVRLCPALPRPELFQRLAGYDVGIGLIPENPLYNVSSPTKTIEYYAVGLPALVNYLPEYLNLFDQESAFFCAFTKEGIQQAVRQILRTGKEELLAMGHRGKQRVDETRNYGVLSKQLFEFLQSL